MEQERISRAFLVIIVIVIAIALALVNAVKIKENNYAERKTKKD